MSDKYDTCKKCGAKAVHLAVSGGIAFFGDEDDNYGNPSEYEGVVIEEDETEVGVAAHICFECKEVEDAWIEYPHHGDDERILNWLQAQWSQRLGTGPAHELACRVHLGEDLRDVAKELMGRGE